MAKHKKTDSKPTKFTKSHGRQNDPVKAKKHLGQHFLKDETIAKKISDTLSLTNYNKVIEIGPGTGVLTKHLLAHKIDLFAMDIDTESIAYLKNEFPILNNEVMQGNSKLTVLEADFLKHDLSPIIGNDQFAIIGNFPYNISTQIVFKMLEYKEQVVEFSGMFQKEVAARICASNGSKTYGILSVLVQAFYNAEYLFTVPPTVFNPPPKVDSGVLKLVRKNDYNIGVDQKLFFTVVKTAFNQRRKTLRNSLKTFNLSDNLKEDTIFGLRPEQLEVADFIALTKKIADDTV